MSFSRILVRAANWVGDAVMSLPALRALRDQFPKAEIVILARPWVVDLYARERCADRVIPYTAESGARDWSGKRDAVRTIRADGYDTAILFQNAFEAALIVWAARIPKRIGYNRDGRGLLLTDAIPVPKNGDIPKHESYYYLELLRRAGVLDDLPEVSTIRLDGTEEARAAGEKRLTAEGLSGDVVGVSPGAAFGGAKRWLPERFADAARRVAAARGGGVALFGAPGERGLCESIVQALAPAGVTVRNFAGETSLAEFMELAAACSVFLTNDSGAMHVASALGVATVAIFGPTDHIATAPRGPVSRIVREPVECAPCKLRECPIDHRCMRRVSAERVAETALELLK